MLVRTKIRAAQGGSARGALDVRECTPNAANSDLYRISLRRGGLLASAVLRPKRGVPTQPLRARLAECMQSALASNASGFGIGSELPVV